MSTPKARPVSDATRNVKKRHVMLNFSSSGLRHCGREPGSAYGGIRSKCKSIVNHVFR